MGSLPAGWFSSCTEISSSQRRGTIAGGSSPTTWRWCQQTSVDGGGGHSSNLIHEGVHIIKMPSISFMPINMSGLPNRMWRFMVLEEASRSIRFPEIRSLSGVIKAISKRRSMLSGSLQCIPNPDSWKTLGELLLCRKSSELSTLDLSPTFSCQSTQMSLQFIGILFPPFVSSVCFVLFFPQNNLDYIRPFYWNKLKKWVQILQH